MAPSKPEANVYHSESLARGLPVIRAFSCDSPRLRAVDGAAKNGISRAVARRFLLTSQDLSYVDSEGEPFYLRPALLNLGFLLDEFFDA
jgi:IclR family pca regulon transcriptional regulator